MSSRRKKVQSAAVEAVWRLLGIPEARLFVDTGRNGVQCVACDGKGHVFMYSGIDPAVGATAMQKLLAGAGRTTVLKKGETITQVQCPLCRGKGALHPRAPMDPDRRVDQAIAAGNRP